MSAYLFMRGIVRQGRLHEFVRAVKALREYRKTRAYCVPEVLYGLSGPMNTVLLRFAFPDLGRLEQEERELEADPEYARMNSALPYVEGSITYEIYLDDRFGKPELDPDFA
jgi:hypothetical protein